MGERPADERDARAEARMCRRELIKKTGLATGAAWVAPTILSSPLVHAATTGPGGRVLPTAVGLAVFRLVQSGDHVRSTGTEQRLLSGRELRRCTEPAG